MNTHQTSQTLRDAELPTDWRATITVGAVRLCIFVCVWGYSLWFFDDPRVESFDPFIVNLRVGFWIYLVEFLTGLYFRRYSPPMPPAAAWRFALRESLTQSGRTCFVTLINVVLRWGIIAAATALLVRLPTPSRLVLLFGAVLPTMIVHAIRWAAGGYSGAPVPGLVRGTHVGTYSEAQSRAAEIMAEARGS